MEGILGAIFGFLLSEAGLYTIIAVLALVLVGWGIRSISNWARNRSDSKRKTKEIDTRLDPMVKAVTEAGAKRERGPSPNLVPLREAAAALIAEIDAVRADILDEVTGARPAEPTPEVEAEAPEQKALPRKPQVFDIDDNGDPVPRKGDNTADKAE